MKSIVFCFICLFAKFSYSQSYNFGALGTVSLAVKCKGNINISDKNVIFETLVNEKKELKEYQLIKKVNNIVYFTDGVMTHYLSFVEKKGTKKGFDYDTWVVFNSDKSQVGTEPIIYYCKLQ